MAQDTSKAQLRNPEAIASRIEETRERVRLLIRNGTLRPGERVNEQALAAQLGVSRHAAREALRSLEQIGLVTIIPNRGAEVRRVTLEDALHLYDIRAGLARTSGRLIALRIDADEEQHLHDILNQMDAAIEARDQKLYHDLNADFHHALIGITKNPRLIALNEAVEAELKLYLQKGVFTLPQMRASQFEHRKIMAALMNGEPEAAAEAFEKHILTGKQRMLDTVGGQVGRSSPLDVEDRDVGT